MATEIKKQVFTDERTRNKIDLHLRDINDEITDKDIANVKTDVTVLTNEEDHSIENEATKELESIKKEDKNNREDGNNSNSIESPWNILD